MSRSKAAATTERAVKATTSRHVNLIWPLLIWVGLWVLAEGTYLLFHYVLPEYLPWVAVFSTLCLVGVCAAVWKQAGSRVRDRGDTHAVRGLVYATSTAAAASLWLIFGMIGNPLSPGLMVFWGFGLFGVVLWVIRMIMDRADAKAHENGQPSRRGAADRFIESVSGDPKIQARVGKATDEMIDIVVDLTESDIDQAGFRGVAEKMAAAVGVPAHSGIVMPDPSHAGLATARIMLKDVLAEPLPWPGPTEPGGTPFSPITKGRRINGNEARLWVADKTGVRQKCTVGMPGAGKGNGALIELGNALTWQETTIFGIDVRKGFQLFEPIVPALDWILLDRDTARALLTAGIDRLLEGRFRRLGALDPPRTAWEPGCGMQFLWMQIEEASFLDIPDQYLEEIGKSARSAGVHFDWSLQSTLHTQMSTTLRRMFALWAVYGCQDDFETGNLPEELEAAGVNPAKWRDEKPGMNYLSGKGISQAEQATELRDYLPTRDQLAALAVKWGPQPLDQFSADLLGPLYHGRPSPVVVLDAERRRARGGPTLTPVPVVQHHHDRDRGPTPGAVAVLEHDDGDPDDEPRDGDVWRYTEEDLGVTTPYEGLPMDLTYQQALELPLRPGEDVRIGDPNEVVLPNYRPDEESVAWMLAAVNHQVDVWEAEGKRFIRPADFVDTDLCGPSGPRTRSRAYFAKVVKERLVPEGRLQARDEDTGKYMIVPAAGPAAGHQAGGV